MRSHSTAGSISTLVAFQFLLTALVASMVYSLLC